MKKALSIIILFITVVIHAQTYPVGHMSINFKDPARTGGYSISGGINTTTVSGRDIGTEVYYPSTIAGDNKPVANGQFPIVVFGHGFVMGWDSYDNIYNLLAAKGYIVLLPRTEGSFSPAHLEFGSDMRFLANSGLNLNTINAPTALAIFNGKVLQKASIGGHSMGAGSSYLAAANNNSITCLFNFAAATTNPSSISSASLVTIPSLVISGARDCVADTTVQNNHYSALTSTKKFHIILKQLTHCDFGTGSNTNCVFGQSSSGCGNQVNNGLAFTRYMNYLEPFLANQLKNNCSEGQRFMDSLNTNSSFRSGLKQQGSISCVTTENIDINDRSGIFIFPNPTENTINISFQDRTDKSILFELYDISGKQVLSELTENTSNKRELNIETLQNGMYTLIITQDHYKQAHRIIKH